MKHLNNFNTYISEAMKKVKDLNPNIGLFIHLNSLTLYEPKEDKVYAYIGLTQNKNGTFYFTSVAAETGYGPLIFEIALMYCKTKESGLMVTRDGDIRGEAFEVWKKFYHREDTIKKTLDFDDRFYNFAILTGEEDFENEIQKDAEYELYTEEGFGNDIKVYNTKMSMIPSKEFYDLQDKYKELDIDVINDKGHDFFSFRYNTT